MKKVVFSFVLTAVGATLLSCGNMGKVRVTATEVDSTVVEVVTDTLNTAAAVEKQVNAVYDYWNDCREHYDENEDKPSVDECFGSREWREVREQVAAIDRECECGGFFDFGDEGPLDAWVYDCYEGAVSANDIEVKLRPDSTAEVNFLVKDAVTLKGIPIRWLMRIEDGAWRVANIIFVKDDNFDILENMRGYIEYNQQEQKE